MELEGTLELERPPMRRWVLIVAAIVPVIAFVIVAAWFFRAFVAPPMVSIPSPAMLAAAPPPAPARAETPVISPAPTPAAETTANAAPTVETSVHSPGTSMLASIAAVPPALASASTSLTVGRAPTMPMAPPVTTAYAEPAQDAASATAIEPGEPIKEPVPLPAPRRPRVTIAHAALGPVPLPRPRPAEATPRPVPDVQTFDRHSVQ